MKLSLGTGPKFAEKRDERPLWAPDYYPEVGLLGSDRDYSPVTGYPSIGENFNFMTVR